MRTLPRLLVVTLLVLAAAACSDDDGDDVSAEGTADASEETTTTAASDSASEPDPAGSAGPEGSTTSTTAFVSERYADAELWVCRPDRADDPCTTDLDYTVLREDGSTEVVAHEVATDPAFDCFFVYPTVNLSPEGVAELDGQYQVEIDITRAQAGRFSEVCRVYAPLYRQTTFGTGPDVDTDALRAQAYNDVEEAFLHYLANDNDGRPFVLMGHSQGSSHSTRLLQDHVDGDEQLRSQLISALLIGTVITAPEGEDVGGDFENLPACRREDQTACIVTYASFDAADPPDPEASFGAPRDGGEGVALCTNPAAIAGGSSVLQMIDNAGIDSQATFGAPVETPYVALPDFVSGECVTQDGRTYLAITVMAGDGPRTDTLNNSSTGIPWGLHPLDYSLALGDLVDLVEQQAAAHSGGSTE